jgi:hypothetical protein
VRVLMVPGGLEASFAEPERFFDILATHGVRSDNAES